MLPETMKAARLHEIGAKFQIDDLQIPKPRSTDVLVKVDSAAIVQNLRNVISVYSATRPHLPLPKLPAIFGLDAAGTVAAVGERVDSEVAVGDRVYVNPGLSCGACVACRGGNAPNCPDYTFMGYFGFGPRSQNQFDGYPYGGFSEYLVAPVANLVKLPHNVTFEQASRFGYLGTAYSGLRKLDFRPGQTLIVNGGTGTLGVGAVLLGLAMGASRIFATGRDRARLAKLKAIAPHRIEAIAFGEGTVTEQVISMTGGLGADAMLESLAPNSPAQAVMDAFGALRRGGKAVNVGGVTETLPLLPSRLMTQQKSLIGSLWFTTKEGEDMAAMAKAKTLDLSVFEHESFPLDRINEALDAIDGRTGGFTNIVIKHR